MTTPSDGVSFGGVPLTWPTDPASDWLAKYRLLARLNDRRDAGQSGASNHLPLAGHSSPEPPALMRLHWPVGASRHAHFHALLSDSAADLVRATASPSPLVFKQGPASVSASMWSLGPRPLAPGLWLLTLVDSRYWWRMRASAVTASGTWVDAVKDLLAAAGATVPSFAVPAEYGAPDPTRWGVGVEPLPELIDAALAAVGRRLVVDLDGTVRVADPATALAAQAAAIASLPGVLAGGVSAPADLAKGLPEKAGVVFYGDPDAVSLVTLASVPGSLFGSGATGVPGAVVRLGGELPASASASARSNYAAKAAADWYSWRLSRVGCVFPGVVDWRPTGLEWTIEWSAEPDAKVTTAVARPPESDWSLPGSLLGAGAGVKDMVPVCSMPFRSREFRCVNGVGEYVTTYQRPARPGCPHYYCLRHTDGSVRKVTATSGGPPAAGSGETVDGPYETAALRDAACTATSPPPPPPPVPPVPPVPPSPPSPPPPPSSGGGELPA